MITLEEFQEIRLSEHLIVLDTNILLELYRQPSNISLDIIKALKQIIKNIYVPRQVFDEYLKNYKKVCGIEKRKYQNVSKELSESMGKLQRDIASRIIEYRKHNYTDISNLQNILDEKFEEINEIIKQFENGHKEEIEQNLIFLQNDKVMEFVEQLVEEGNVGKKIPFSRRLIILQEGKVRFENLIPPGYKDDEKVGVDRFGDLFVWKDIIEVAEEKNTNILFLCNDIKEDWWKKDKELPIELREELLDEFKETNSLLEIHFLTLERFFSYIAEELKIGQSKSALQLSALDYVSKYLMNYEDYIKKKVKDIYSTIHLSDFLVDGFLLFASNEEIYWSITNVTVEKENKKVIYYINLDISILADCTYEEDGEYPRNFGKVAFVLNGKLNLITEEYSRVNQIDDIYIGIEEVFNIIPSIWERIKIVNGSCSCKQMIATSKEIAKYQEELNYMHSNKQEMVGKLVYERKPL